MVGRDTGYSGAVAWQQDSGIPTSERILKWNGLVFGLGPFRRINLCFDYHSTQKEGERLSFPIT